MRIRQHFIPVCLSVLLITGAGLAQGNGNRPGVRPGALRQGAPFAQVFEVRQFIAGLNLTEDQRAQVNTVMANNRIAVLQAARDMVQARLNLLKGLPGAAADVANAQLKAEDLRAQIAGQIKAFLTSDQLAKLEKREQLREERLQKLLDNLNERLNK